MREDTTIPKPNNTIQYSSILIIYIIINTAYHQKHINIIIITFSYNNNKISQYNAAPF